MKPILYFFLLLAALSCSKEINHNDEIQIDSGIDSTAVAKDSNQKTIPDHRYDLITNTSDFRLDGKEWMEIESAGNPDTALALFAYRILFIEQSDDMNDCEIRKNLIESSTAVKQLLPRIFAGHIDSSKVDFWVDSLNRQALNFAEHQVKLDIEEYGASEGPCFELYQLKKK